MPPGRPRTLLSVPCDTHGDGPCPSPKGCINRRLRAGLGKPKPRTKGVKLRPSALDRLDKEIKQAEDHLLKLREKRARTTPPEPGS